MHKLFRCMNYEYYQWPFLLLFFYILDYNINMKYNYFHIILYILLINNILIYNTNINTICTDLLKLFDAI